MAKRAFAINCNPSDHYNILEYLNHKIKVADFLKINMSSSKCLAMAVYVTIYLTKPKPIC